MRLVSFAGSAWCATRTESRGKATCAPEARRAPGGRPAPCSPGLRPWVLKRKRPAFAGRFSTASEKLSRLLRQIDLPHTTPIRGHAHEPAFR